MISTGAEGAGKASGASCVPPLGAQPNSASQWAKAWRSPGETEGGVPRFGGHVLFPGAAAVCLALLVSPFGKFNWKLQIHVWTAVYCGGIVASSVALLFEPWIFAMCPGSGHDVQKNKNDAALPAGVLDLPLSNTSSNERWYATHG